MDAVLLVEGLLGSGFAGVVVLTFAEKLLPIVPSSTILIYLGMSQVDAQASFFTTLAAATGGSTLGAAAWYALGRRIGAARVDALVRRFGRYVFLSEGVYGRLTATYLKRGFSVSMLGQVVPTARVWLPLPAGTIGISFLPFLAATALGSLAWNTPFMLIGWLLQDWQSALAGLVALATALWPIGA